MIGGTGTEEWQEILMEDNTQAFGLRKSNGLYLFPEGKFDE